MDMPVILKALFDFFTNPYTICVCAALCLLVLIAMWKVFRKAGRAGWKAVIPFYSAFTYWDVAWEEEQFLVVLAGSVAVGLLYFAAVFMGWFGRILYIAISFGWGIFALVRTIQMGIRMAHRFGKSTAFGVVLIALFSFIGLPILAWGSADYDEKRDFGDGVLRTADGEKQAV